MSDHNNERQEAEALEQFLQGFGDGKTQSPEQELAAAIREAAHAEHAPDAFKARTESALRSVIAARHGDKIIALPYGADTLSTRRWWRRLPGLSPTLTAAAVALVVLIGVVFWLLPAADDAPTATPVRARMVNPLPAEVGAFVTGFDHAERAALDTAGITWVAYRVTYAGAASTEAIFAELEPIIDATHGQARSLMVTVEGQPGWDDGHLPAFVADLAQRGVDAVEVLPEANIQRGNGSPFIAPADYVQLMTQVHTAVRAVSDDTVLITGAPALTGAEATFDNVHNTDTYYEGLLATGIEAVADCIGVSYLEGMVPPYAFSGDARDDYHARYLPTTLLTARQYVRETPLCLTAVGYYTGSEADALLSAYAWAQTITPAEQAVWSADIVEVVAQLERNHDVDVRLTVFTRLSPVVVDEPTVQSQVDAGYALLDASGACAACEAISLLRDDLTLAPFGGDGGG